VDNFSLQIKFMKSKIIFAFASPFLACLISCQSMAQSENLDRANIVQGQNFNVQKVDSKVNQAVEVQPTKSPKAKPLKTNNISLKVGLVDVNKNDVICLRTRNDNLSPNSRVLIIGSPYEKPQKTLKAFVEKKLNSSCVDNDSDIGEDNPAENIYYSLKLDGNDVDESYIGIGIAIFDFSKPIAISDGLANVDLNDDGKNEYFRGCASNEGLHLTVWQGKPLIGKRVWHRYYYLHYDTEADCKKKDWEGTDD
jgi:hypothetical protein